MINDKYDTMLAGKLMTVLLESSAHKATKYLGPTEVVRATRILQRGKNGKKIPKRGNIDIRVTIGKPNYAERRFIAICKKAGESFPVKNIQLKFPPKRANG